MESKHSNPQADVANVCDECGHQVTTIWHDHAFVYGSGEVAAELSVRLPVRRCDHCDFDYLDEEGERIKHEAVCHHLGVLTPQEIRGIRGHLRLSRAALAVLTGIGEASLSRWENGIKIQTTGYDRYLRLLCHPGIQGLLMMLVDHAPSTLPLRDPKSKSDKVTAMPSVTPIVLPRPPTFRYIKETQQHTERRKSFSLRLGARLAA